MTPSDWVIEYYVEDSGSVPVREFLNSLLLFHGTADRVVARVCKED
jgi:hypothetical protein